MNAQDIHNLEAQFETVKETSEKLAKLSEESTLALVARNDAIVQALRAGASQVQLAMVTGLSQASIGRIERNAAAVEAAQ